MAATPPPAAPVGFVNTLYGSIRRNGDVALALGVFGVIAILIVPLPALLLDVFLALSITHSLLIFTTSRRAVSTVTRNGLETLSPRSPAVRSSAHSSQTPTVTPSTGRLPTQTLGSSTRREVRSPFAVRRVISGASIGYS